MAKLLSGKEVAENLNARIVSRSLALKEAGVVPTLLFLRAGEDESALSYEKGIEKRAAALGIATEKKVLDAAGPQEEFLKVIRQANEKENIHGVLLLRPLPADLEEPVLANALDPAKDVDAMTDLSLSGVFTDRQKGYAPCTAQACMEILDYYGISCSGKRAVVIGRSLTVGRPAAMMLLKRNATVTICHTKTENLASVAKEADILITAAGAAKTVNASFCRPGQVIIDVGINADKDGRLCGDVDEESIAEIAAAYTPVPGGVGAVTTSVLLAHVVDAAEKMAQQRNPF